MMKPESAVEQRLLAVRHSPQMGLPPFWFCVLQGQGHILLWGARHPLRGSLMPGSSMPFATLKTTQEAAAKRKLRPEEALSRSQVSPRLGGEDLHANCEVAIPLWPCLGEPGWRWVQEMRPLQRLPLFSQASILPTMTCQLCRAPQRCWLERASARSPLEATLIQQLSLCICGVSGRPYVGRLHPPVGQQTSGEETGRQPV